MSLHQFFERLTRFGRGHRGLPDASVDEDARFPYREILLKPVAHPTLAQIRFFHRQWRPINFLESRTMLMKGGYAAFLGLQHCDQVPELVAQLDALGLPYEVRVSAVNRYGVVDKRRVRVESPRSFWDDLPAVNAVVRTAVIDLSKVKNRDEFMEAIYAHFPAGNDPYAVWHAINRALFDRSFSWQIQFIGWPDFAKRMPRYAKRLDRTLGERLTWHPASLHVKDMDWW